jgi:dipeptidyl-peptidase-3
VYWLEKAVTVAENDKQKKALTLLVQYYKTGDLKIWDEYNIAWVNDTESRIDVVNGFIEVYDDAIGKRASFESVVSIKDMEATKRIAAIAKEAQWFEDHSPI